MRLRFTLQARQDLDDIANHIREQNPQAALRLRTAIIDSLRTLVLFPRIGRRQTTAGVRKLVTRRYPYIVYYTIDDASKEIVILTVRHPARGREHADE
jgi:toxin ParE1/3/4